MELIDVVNKLVGDISPIGSHNEDLNRLENLKVMCELVEDLHTQICKVSSDNADRHEDSMRRCGQYAQQFLGNLIF